MTDQEQPKDVGLSAESMQSLLFIEAILQAIVVEAEAKGDPRLDNPELREGRPGAREQLKLVQDELERRRTTPVDQVVGLQTLTFSTKAPGL